MTENVFQSQMRKFQFYLTVNVTAHETSLTHNLARKNSHMAYAGLYCTGSRHMIFHGKNVQKY